MTDTATWIAAIGTAIGAIMSGSAAIAAFSGLRESKRFRIQSSRPLIILENPQKSTTSSIGTIFMLFSYTLRNAGNGPAVLKDLTGPRTLAYGNQKIYIQGGQSAGFTNVLASGDTTTISMSFSCAIGVPQGISENMCLEYTDATGRNYWTDVEVDLSTGTVMRMKQGPEELTLLQQWKRWVDQIDSYT